jgi:AcrR family transcriptional regulator
MPKPTPPDDPGLAGYAPRQRVPRGRPRKQEERRAQTRAKVLDATIRSVLDDGYAHTTVRHVAELAGVSAGAMAHYFPHRVDLVAAAIEHLAERRIQTGRELAATLPSDPKTRMPALLDLLWADFSSPIFTVFVKLWIAAVDDPELYARLAATERQIARAMTETVIESIGELVTRSGWESRLLVVLAAMRGLALTEHFEPRTEPRTDPWPSARQALLATLDA